MKDSLSFLFAYLYLEPPEPLMHHNHLQIKPRRAFTDFTLKPTIAPKNTRLDTPIAIFAGIESK